MGPIRNITNAISDAIGQNKGFAELKQKITGAGPSKMHGGEQIKAMAQETAKKIVASEAQKRMEDKEKGG